MGVCSIQNSATACGNDPFLKTGITCPSRFSEIEVVCPSVFTFLQICAGRNHGKHGRIQNFPCFSVVSFLRSKMRCGALHVERIEGFPEASFFLVDGEGRIGGIGAREGAKGVTFGCR